MINCSAIMQKRYQMRMSQAVVADRAGVDRKVVMKLENKPNHDPHLSIITSIAKVLGMSVGEMIVEQGEEKV